MFMPGELVLPSITAAAHSRWPSALELPPLLPQPVLLAVMRALLEGGVVTKKPAASQAALRHDLERNVTEYVKSEVTHARRGTIPITCHLMRRATTPEV